MEVSRFIKKFGIFIILVLSIIFYFKIFYGFFQQDEWFGYGWFVLHKNLNLIDSLKFFFYPSVSHYNPITVAIQQILFSIWGLNYINFAIIGLILHLLVVFSFFLLARKIFKEKIQALIATLIFASFASGFQAVTWVVTDIATLSASVFAIFSSIFYLDFLRKGKNSLLFLSLLFLFISLLFKEIALSLLLIYVGAYLFYKKKVNKYLFWIIGFGIIYFIFRFLMIFVPPISSDGVVTQYLSLRTIIYNFLTLPLKSITYTFVQPDLFKNLMMKAGILFPEGIRGVVGSPDFEKFVVKRLMEIGSTALGFLILVLGIRLVRKSKSKNFKFTILFGLSWAFFNSFIFALSPGTSGITLVPDSRNLYFLSMGIALFLAGSFNKRRIFLVVFIVLNIIWLNNNITNFISSSGLRRNILNQIKMDYPKLPSKVIFYVESDSSFYGLPENVHIMPFQSGFGQTLLSWYEKDQNFPIDFFKNNYLWDIKSQEYKEINGIGFGYFRNFDQLLEVVSRVKFNVDNVIGYSYNSKNQILVNITKEINTKLVVYEKKK
jgi:hypothetical protein